MENAAFHATYIYSIDFSAVNHFRELYKRIYDGFHLSGMRESGCFMGCFDRIYRLAV